MTPSEVLAFAKDNDVKMVDYRFVDVPGAWQHFSSPIDELEEETFEEGVGFDGSSIRGFQTIDKSDMILIPDPVSAKLDPFTEVQTLILICNVKDPITLEMYTRDPRYIAQKAEAYIQSIGLADIAYFGAEAEFYIFDDVRFYQEPNSSYYKVDSGEGWWNTGSDEGPNLGNKIPYKRGYFPVPPVDSHQDLRTRMVLTLKDLGIHAEVQHHEVGSGGQAEIDIRFNTLLRHADDMMMYKYVVKNVAHKVGKTVTFMPKPIYQDNGSGMHVHQSIWKDGKPLFAGDKYADLSDEALYYIGGILKHAKALNAFTNPSTNSYKRLIPGFEAPVLRAYSARNRSGCVRIPWTESPKAKRVEARFPDPSANPYLCFSALMMAGLDGIKNKIDPGEAMDKNLYDLPPEELADIPTVCGSLREALDALAADHEFLLAGDVFTKSQIEGYIELKMEEVQAYEHTPHPVEYGLYYSC